MIFVASTGNRIWLNLTWAHKGATHMGCYNHHVWIFFQVLQSVDLSKATTRGLQSLAEFDFRKLSFYDPFKLSFRSPEHLNMKSMLQNVRRFRYVNSPPLTLDQLDTQLQLLRPCVFRNWWISLWSRTYKHHYTVGHGEKRALLKMRGGQVWNRPYSSRRFKEWAKRQREVCSIERYTG